MHHVADLKATLKRFESSDPDAIRKQCLDAIVDTIPCEFGLFLPYVTRGGEIFHSGFIVRGDGEADQILSPLHDVPFLSRNLWDPRHPRPIEKQRFVSIEHGPVPFESISQSEGYRLVYEPFGIRDHARVLLYDGRRFLGWFGLMRGPHQLFSRRELEELNHLVPEIAAAMVVAEDLEHVAAENLHLVVDSQGLGTEWATRSARTWLNASRADALDGLLRAFRRGEAGPIACIGGYEVRIVELVGDRGTAYHVHITHGAAPCVGLDGLLTPRQREVAEVAVSGATVSEIGVALAISPHTVASHLRIIYDKLGISSRAELAALLVQENLDSSRHHTVDS